MKKIGLLSDTHGTIHPRVSSFFKECDEIWHAGDIGNIQTADALNRIKPLRAVYGNIDGGSLRVVYPEYLFFTIEKIAVLIIHIGGYPGRYTQQARELIGKYKPKLFISGHSHILKVMYDKKHNLLHINPGAAGNSGFHQKITLVRFVIDGNEIKDMEVLDIERLKG